MVSPTKILTATLLLMMIQKTRSCLVPYPIDEIIRLENIKKRVRKQNADIKVQEERKQALYREEEKLLQAEPDFFPEPNDDFQDFAELLPEVYGYSGDGAIIGEDDADYPEFPTEADSDYDYSEFGNLTQTAEENDEENYDDEKFEDYHGDYFPVEKRNKRDAGQILGGLMESGEKLLSGNMVGSIASFIKTLAKPVFHYFIKSDNDKAMTKFTHRLLPETGFKGSSNALVISKAARQGDGERVWSTIAENTQKWNPKSAFKEDKFHKSEIYL